VLCQERCLACDFRRCILRSTSSKFFAERVTAMARESRHVASSSRHYYDPRRASESTQPNVPKLDTSGSEELKPPVPPKDTVVRNAIPKRVEATGEKAHDPNVTFEEYIFWARYSRADERYENPNRDIKIFGKTIHQSRSGDAVEKLPYTPGHGVRGKHVLRGQDAPPPSQLNITDEDWVAASRAVRTASWGAIFYLITTDILGPFSTPYAFAAVCLFSPFTAEL
jgi:hypothetical protein